MAARNVANLVVSSAGYHFRYGVPVNLLSYFKRHTSVCIMLVSVWRKLWKLSELTVRPALPARSRVNFAAYLCPLHNPRKRH
jgi:hypothetical protein